MTAPATSLLDRARVPRGKAVAPRRRETVPIVRHLSSSSRGGWPFFCRLLLWATRNAGERAGRRPD